MHSAICIFRLYAQKGREYMGLVKLPQVEVCLITVSLKTGCIGLVCEGIDRPSVEVKRRKFKVNQSAH